MNTLPQWFTGQRALITGAADGLGYGIATTLQAMGADIIVNDINQQLLEERFPEGVQRIVGLLGGQTERIADEALRDGPVPLLVNNVGVGSDCSFLTLPTQERDANLAMNLLGPWTLAQRLCQALVAEQQPGAIVWISSLHDHRIRRQIHYSASKAALRMVMAEMAAELAPHHIRVNTVSPGGVSTPDNAGQPAAHYPLGRRQDPQEIARMVAVLLSDEWSGMVTGQNVAVDGGLDLFSWWTNRPNPAR